MTSDSVDVIPMVIEVIGIHLMPFMLIGRVIPPKGKEYDASSVVSSHFLLLTTMVKGGIPVY